MSTSTAVRTDLSRLEMTLMPQIIASKGNEELGGRQKSLGVRRGNKRDYRLLPIIYTSIAVFKDFVFVKRSPHKRVVYLGRVDERRNCSVRLHGSDHLIFAASRLRVRDSCKASSQAERARRTRRDCQLNCYRPHRSVAVRLPERKKHSLHA